MHRTAVPKCHSEMCRKLDGRMGQSACGEPDVLLSPAQAWMTENIWLARVLGELRWHLS